MGQQLLTSPCSSSWAAFGSSVLASFPLGWVLRLLAAAGGIRYILLTYLIGSLGYAIFVAGSEWLDADAMVGPFAVFQSSSRR